jgi:FtsZ-binding cell division protein ZapB
MADWFDSITNIISLLFGGSVISVFTWKIARRKAAAEAAQAEIEAVKAKQDYYQQMMQDLATDRDYWKHGYEELRNTIRQYDERIADLEHKVARNSRQVANMRPFICGNINCKMRQYVVFSDEGEIQKPETPEATKPEQNDIEPNNDL